MAANPSASPLDPNLKVAVIGAGAMGSGIAHVAARAGHPVYLFDMNGEAVKKGIAGIEKDLRFLVGKGKLSEADCAATLARITPASELALLADAGLLIEAIVEKLDVKQKLFGDLEALVGEGAILASNTSSLSITAIAAPLKRPERLLGLHFFNPAPRMALVEIISGLASDPALAAVLYATAKAWGKVPVHARSTPGFIVNRVARPYYAEGIRVLEEQGAGIATLDALMREACGFPMGPFELTDMIGHDVNFAVTNSVFNAYFGDKRFTPSLSQQELVLAGRLGRKSGHGFYPYGEGAPKLAAHVVSGYGAPRCIAMIGELGVAEALAARIAQTGVTVLRQPAPGVPVLAFSDGRTATARSADEGLRDLVVFDLALDFARTPRLAVAAADQCSEVAFQAVAGALQAAGIAVSRLDDVAGLIGLRTVCMLANEAADAVTQGIATAEDVDAAMRHGTNYPKGPLAWADQIGAAYVAKVLLNLRDHYGEERYRLSPLIRRRARSHGRFHA